MQRILDWKKICGLSAAVGFIFPQLAFGQNPGKSPGINVTYISENKTTDATIAPNVWLYVPATQSPTPFLPSGKFTATWNGFISVDLRGEYSFQAELNGSLKLEVNGQLLLETNLNGATELTKSIRLGKGGTNALVATFSSPAQGDSFLRLYWKPKDSFVQPIPIASLSHQISPEQQKADKLRLGRELFLEHRCVKCHVGPKPESGIPELSMDAPSLDDIGARRNYDWMSRWILDPKNLRPTAHMPKLLHGAEATKDAQAIAAYLASLKPADFKSSNGEPKKEQAESGKKLFESLHCVACHNAPDSGENDEKKIALKQVAAKFVPETLTAFLKQPNAHYAWIRMPQFKLSDEQRGQLAAYLLSNSDKPKEATAPSDKDTLERGKKLVQTSGCLNCHSLKLENQFSTKILADISADKCKAGCLAETPGDKAPQFGFTAEEREALQAFTATDRASLTRHVPIEFAQRHVQKLNCTECHGKFEGFPPFDVLGGKLKPEWMEKFIAGEVKDKPRHWLESQMPAFPKYAEELAKGLAMQHGFPPKTPEEPSIEKEASEVGNKLVSNPPLGFSCISCHSIGSVGATQVFEAPGINLASTGERLQHSFFKRWVRNPPLVDPQTKMPVYFDEEGKSPITDVLEGDALKQIEALWQYVRLGSKMPPPRTD